MRVPQTLNQTWKNLDIDLNHDTILSEVPDEECGEEDSIATTVKVTLNFIFKQILRAREMFVHEKCTIFNTDYLTTVEPTHNMT